MITGEQIRAAREMLRMKQSELSSLSGLSIDTIKRIEAMRGMVSANTNTVTAIITVLQDQGITFITKDKDGGPGVRLVE